MKFYNQLMITKRRGDESNLRHNRDQIDETPLTMPEIPSSRTMSTVVVNESENQAPNRLIIPAIKMESLEERGE